MSSAKDSYATNTDGSAKDPAAFRQALLADSEKIAALDSEPEVLKVVKGEDMQAFQELLRTVYAVSFSAFSKLIFIRREMAFPSEQVHLSHITSLLHVQAEKKRLERVSKSMAERTIDAQRASATVPR